ncbi:MAG: NAD(P)H-dependent oxidoreductase [Lachnospiraceae bacterium]|nr:NAD(P)H-dependent oxidoreductase [Lachnospiraceae bacterium]
MWIVLGLITFYGILRRKNKNQVCGHEKEVDMKILILYDSTATDDNGVNWLSLLLTNLDSDYCIQTVLLDSREIKPCIGCFSCWTKTPGTCVITNDNANLISSSYINADKVVLLSRVTYGGYSADTKAFLDRSIINISPFFTVKSGEMHHQKRYLKYPDLIAFGYGDMTDDERDTFMELSKRNALNLHPPKHIAFTVRNQNEIMQVIQDLRIFMAKEAI